MRAGLFALSLLVLAAAASASAQSLPTWGLTWTYNGITYKNDRMVGNSPTTTGSTINAYVIPVDLVVNGETFTTSTLQPNGPSAYINTVLSPLFSNDVDFVQSGKDLGTTQYLDAFERGNYWFKVRNNTNYHLLLSPQGIATSVTITVPPVDGHVGVNNGAPWAYVDNHWLKSQLQLVLAANPQITPASLAVFLTYDTFLINPGPYYGVHDTFGKQTYIIATYSSVSGAGEDVSGLSHELGEWANDPFHNNSEPCGGLLEDADPLNGHEYAYTVTEPILNTFTFHLQDLVYLNYFGAPTALNGELSFQNEKLSVCSNGP